MEKEHNYSSLRSVSWKYRKEVDCVPHFVPSKSLLEIIRISVVSSDFTNQERIEVFISGNIAFFGFLSDAAQYFPYCIFELREKVFIPAQSVFFCSFPSGREYTTIFEGVMESVV